MQHGRAEDLDVQRAADSGLSPVRQVYSPGPRRADMQTRPDQTGPDVQNTCRTPDQQLTAVASSNQRSWSSIPFIPFVTHLRQTRRIFSEM